MELNEQLAYTERNLPYLLQKRLGYPVDITHEAAMAISMRAAYGRDVETWLEEKEVKRLILDIQ